MNGKRKSNRISGKDEGLTWGVGHEFTVRPGNVAVRFSITMFSCQGRWQVGYTQGGILPDQDNRAIKRDKEVEGENRKRLQCRQSVK